MEPLQRPVSPAVVPIASDFGAMSDGGGGQWTAVLGFLFGTLIGYSSAWCHYTA